MKMSDLRVQELKAAVESMRRAEKIEVIRFPLNEISIPFPLRYFEEILINKDSMTVEEWRVAAQTLFRSWFEWLDSRYRAIISYDYSLLAKRIREGTAENDERDLAARILEGRVKRRKPKSYETFARRMQLYFEVDQLISSREKPDIAYDTVAAKFDVSRETVRTAHREIIHFFSLEEKLTEKLDSKALEERRPTGEAADARIAAIDGLGKIIFQAIAQQAQHKKTSQVEG